MRTREEIISIGKTGIHMGVSNNQVISWNTFTIIELLLDIRDLLIINNQKGGVKIKNGLSSRTKKVRRS